MSYIKVEPVIDHSMRGMCIKSYPNHPKGCPNYGKKKICPPKYPTLDKLILLTIKQPIYAIYNKFDFKEHCDRMRKRHPMWSKRQVECCLYWQGRARKFLKENIKKFIKKHPHYDIVQCPEAAGVNLTATMKNAGIKLEWPPVNYTYQIVLAGIPKGDFRYEE